MIALPKDSVSLVKWIFVLLVAIALAFSVYVLVKIGQPASTGTEHSVFTVESGATGKSIAADLEEQGLINSSYFFELYLYFKNSAEKIQAGDYELSANMSIRQIVNRLVSGDALFDYEVLRVIEGWTLNDIASELEKIGLVSQSEFFAVTGTPRVGGAANLSADFNFLSDLGPRDTLEGFLYPDTYFIDADSTAEDIVRKMLENFAVKASSILDDADSDKSIKDIITLASLVEREVGRNLSQLDDKQIEDLQIERGLVAGVFMNRLEVGMALQSDATISYITGNKSARATIEETKIDSPYNTYQNTGLPPGPIANPSASSIKAAANPTETNYLFFLTDSDGVAHFAEDLQGHIENRNKYLEN